MLKRQVIKISLCSLVALVIQPWFSPCSTGAPLSALPQTVVIMGRSLSLTEQKGGAPGQEGVAAYVTPGEGFDNWTLMFAVHFFPGRMTPKAAAQKVVENIKNRKATGHDSLANAAIFESKDGQSVDVDFLVSSPRPQMLEHNVWRYSKTMGGLCGYQIARRMYGSRSNQVQVSRFIKSIPASRAKLIEELSRSDLPRWPI
jgi:hypothetical protein